MNHKPTGSLDLRDFTSLRLTQSFIQFLLLFIFLFRLPMPTFFLPSSPAPPVDSYSSTSNPISLAIPRSTSSLDKLHPAPVTFSLHILLPFPHYYQRPQCENNIPKRSGCHFYQRRGQNVSRILPRYSTLYSFLKSV